MTDKTLEKPQKHPIERLSELYLMYTDDSHIVFTPTTLTNALPHLVMEIQSILGNSVLVNDEKTLISNLLILSLNEFFDQLNTLASTPPELAPFQTEPEYYHAAVLKIESGNQTAHEENKLNLAELKEMNLTVVENDFSLGV